MSISPCPPVAASWRWASTIRPHWIIISIISERRSCMRIRGGHGEIAFLVAELVAEIGRSRPGPCSRRPRSLPGSSSRNASPDRSGRRRRRRIRVRGRRGGVGDAGVLHVVDGLAGDVPRIARVVFLGQRILDVADHRQGRVLAERVEERGVRHGHDEHVGLVDRLPAANAGAVETEAFLEDRFVEASAGMVKCCQMPGKSMKRRSTARTSFCLIRARTSFGVMQKTP